MFEFRLPDLGEGIHEGEVLKWHVEVGQRVDEDAPLVDVETDKAAVTIPSPRGGVLRSANGKPGDVVRTGQVLCTIDEDAQAEVTASAEPAGAGTQVAASATDTGVSNRTTAPPAAAPAEPTAVTAPASDAASSPRAPVAVAIAPIRPQARDRKVPATPATRRLARELGVDLAAATPTGPAGRVVPDDVRRLASGAAARILPEAGGGDDAPSPGPVPHPGTESIPLLDLEPLPDFSAWGPVRREPLRSIRRKTARRMVTSAILVPHVAHLDEIDVTALEALRRQQRERRAGRPGAHLTLLAFMVKAVALGLREHPRFNASLDPFAGEIVLKDYLRVGVAVDSGHGLIVPVIPDTDRQGIVRIADALEDLSHRVREGTLTVDDLRGGTFTITNIGSLGGTGLLPLVNYPEVAILGMARAAPKPVVRDGGIVVRTMLPVVLSFDHRIADGADAARFVNDLKRRLEDPMDLLLEA